MSSKFLSSGSSDLSSLQDGTFDLNVRSAKISSLTPSKNVESNTDRDLISGAGSVITNPYVGTIKASDFETDDYFSLNDELQKIDNFNPSTLNNTNIAGHVNPHYRLEFHSHLKLSNR